MPIYTFQCKKCEITYEELTSYDKLGKYKKVSCPECGSKSKKKALDNFEFNFTDPVGTDRWQSHDYRYYYNAPNVRKQREAAEKASHVGPTPYNKIDDVNTGKYFGEVK